MAGTWRADMFQSSFLLGGGLMVIVAFAQPDLSCPEFVTRYGMPSQKPSTYFKSTAHVNNCSNNAS